MIGVTVNALAIIAGSLLGLLLKKVLSKKVSDAVMQALGICIFAIGIIGLLKNENQLVLIISTVLGTILGTAIDLDALLTKFGDFIGSKFKNQNGGISAGFVSASLIFCIGSMAITGSLTAGAIGDNTILFTKSVLDGISSIMLAASLGIGVALSSVAVFAIQGVIALLAGLLTPLLESSSNEIIACGSLMILAIGLNMMGLSKIKVANLVPALFFVPFIQYLFTNIM